MAINTCPAHRPQSSNDRGIRALASSLVSNVMPARFRAMRWHHCSKWMCNKTAQDMQGATRPHARPMSAYTANRWRELLAEKKPSKVDCILEKQGVGSPMPPGLCCAKPESIRKTQGSMAATRTFLRRNGVMAPMTAMVHLSGLLHRVLHTSWVESSIDPNGTWCVPLWTQAPVSMSKMPGDLHVPSSHFKPRSTLQNQTCLHQLPWQFSER